MIEHVINLLIIKKYWAFYEYSMNRMTQSGLMIIVCCDEKASHCCRNRFIRWTTWIDIAVAEQTSAHWPTRARQEPSSDQPFLIELCANCAWINNFLNICHRNEKWSPAVETILCSEWD